MIRGCNCLSCIIEKEQLIEAMRKDGIVETEYCNCDACKFRRENYEMAYRIMRRDEAEIYLLANGWKLFIDLCIKEKIIVIEDEPKLPGLPIGFEFPFSKRVEWTDCVNNLYKQGFIVIKT